MSVKKRFLGVDGLDAYGKSIINIADPVGATDAVNKQTLDTSIASAKDRANHTGLQAISTVTGLQAAIDNKVAVVAGKQLSTEDYTTVEKTKLAGLSNYTHPTSGVTAGTYPKVTVDANGHITAGTTLASADIPNLDWAKITTGKPTTVAGYGITDVIGNAEKGQPNGIATLDVSGKVPSSQLPSFVDDVIEAANFAALPGTGETGKIYVTLDNNKTYRWSGSAYVEISASPGSTDAVPEGATNLYFTTARAQAAVTTITGNAATASKLQTARTIGATGDATWSVSFDGSANVSAAITLTNSGVTAGTYKSVTVNAKGLVTGGTNPTTLSGFGITDALSNVSNTTLPLANSNLTDATLTTTTTTANQVLDNFPIASFRTAKYLVQATSGSSYHCLELLLIHNGSTVYLTQYGEIFTGSSLITLDGDINSGNCRLLVTPSNASTVITVQRQTIKA